MNSKELAAAVAKETGLSNAQAAKMVAATLNAIGKSLAKGKDVRLIGFGSFSVAKRGARTGRNPQTGAAIKIAAGKAVKFKAGKGLKDGVNNR
ncbi:MAG: DNA-binding protein HU [Rhodospirillales bacterium RIFCSPLOWO2_12_FULL_58_28]|nr:MAG: DNA-binding protein HU [Rhodospirillales bacterium RIFCSPLOWO2_02_FULL_58_16]OHC78779.1 MAG: DNA-binding protein HU [Rhodospirillales bacterium RIFCSPLOWO2_12_FULL_58_28]